MFSLLLLSTTDLSVDMFNVSCFSKRSSCSLFLRNGIKRSPYINSVIRKYALTNVVSVFFLLGNTGGLLLLNCTFVVLVLCICRLKLP